MNIGTINQSGMELTADFSEIPAQWSANFTVTVEIDSAFSAYTPYLSIGYHSGRKVNAALVEVANGEATIPAVVYRQAGQIPISVTLINGGEVINTRPLFVTVVGAPMVQTDVDPADPSFIAQVNAIIQAEIDRMHANADSFADYVLNGGLEELTAEIKKYLHACVGALTQGAHVYGVLFNKTTSSMQRLFDAVDITTDTTNFCYLGTVNENYSNPFDDIYPWSECKQCNVDITTYTGLADGADITDAVTAWYGDEDFATDGSNGFVGRYTPEFWYTGYEDESGRIYAVSDKEICGWLHHKPSIRSIGFAVDDGNNGITATDGQPLTNIAVSQIHTRAKNAGYALMDVYEYDAECVLYAVEYADMNSQSKLGNGCSACNYEPNTTVSAIEGTTVTLPSAYAPYCIEGATMDAATSKGGVALANRRTVVSAETSGSNVIVTFDEALSLTGTLYVSIHGKNNGDSFGNKSGYLGVNGKNNAWYRGAIMWGNRYAYTLGIYRQTGTGEIWMCPEDIVNNYDALNTSVHYDTGIALPEVSAAKWFALKDVAVPKGLAFFGAAKTEGNIIGDSQYVPPLTSGNTVGFFGGPAHHGGHCGVLCAVWTTPAGSSYWYYSAFTLLKS